MSVLHFDVCFTCVHISSASKTANSPDWRASFHLRLRYFYYFPGHGIVIPEIPFNDLQFMSSSGNSMKRTSAIKWRWSSFTMRGVVPSPSPAKRTVQNDPFDCLVWGRSLIDWLVKLFCIKKKSWNLAVKNQGSIVLKSVFSNSFKMFPLEFTNPQPKPPQPNRPRIRNFYGGPSCLDLGTSAKQHPGFVASTASGV